MCWTAESLFPGMAPYCRANWILLARPGSSTARPAAAQPMSINRPINRKYDQMPVIARDPTRFAVRTSISGAVRLPGANARYCCRARLRCWWSAKGPASAGWSAWPAGWAWPGDLLPLGWLTRPTGPAGWTARGWVSCPGLRRSRGLGDYVQGPRGPERTAGQHGGERPAVDKLHDQEGWMLGAGLALAGHMAAQATRGPGAKPPVIRDV